MKSKFLDLKFQTKKIFDFVDLTDQIKKFLVEVEIKNGLVNIQSLHTSSALMINESEPLLLEDIKTNLEKIASRDNEYNHDNFDIRTVNMCPDECANGHAHCKAIHLPATITLNFRDGELQLGQWQRIFFVELDHSRPRKVQVQIIGE